MKRTGEEDLLYLLLNFLPLRTAQDSLLYRPRRRGDMPRENNIGKRRSCWRTQIALLFAFIVLFATSLSGQTPQPSSVEDQIERVRKENEALREQIRKIEEQQKALQ